MNLKRNCIVIGSNIYFRDGIKNGFKKSDFLQEVTKWFHQLL